MSDNFYFKRKDDELAKTDSMLIATQLQGDGFVLINRNEYRKLTRARKHALDHRAQGEGADEREDTR